MPTGQMKTLFILWTGAEPQTMSQLAQALDVSLGNVAGLIDRSSIGGLVHRLDSGSMLRAGDEVRPWRRL